MLKEKTVPKQSGVDRPSNGSSVESARDQALFASVSFGIGLLMAGIFELIARGTYDYDEFVYLLLGHAITRGRFPYRDFLFYHPPGIVVVMAFLDPLVKHWWVWGRVVTLLLDGATCALVYLVARQFLPRTPALVAVLLCASSPIMLITGTRIMPDSYVMFFTFLAVYLLLRRSSPYMTVIAGLSFGLAIVFKYPAVLILPAALCAAGRRRWLPFLITTVVTAGALLSPFLPYLHQFYIDTVVFQNSRTASPLPNRMLAVLLYAILLQPLAFFGMWLKPRRWWLILGYLSGYAFIFTSQVYYHYMVPIIPFASILGAVYLSSIRGIRMPRLMPAASVAAVALTIFWGCMVEYSPNNEPFHMTAAQAATVSPVSRYVQARTKPGALILDDRPDLPFLAYRSVCDDYFWNDSALLTPQQLMPCITKVHYVVHFFGGGSGFPYGYLEKIQSTWCNRTVGNGGNGAFVYNLHCDRPYVPDQD